MKAVCFALSMLGLVVLLGVPVLEVLGMVGSQARQWAINGGTLLWFAAAPFWIRYRS